ncbi:unnamed protein product [Acanthoscelides obtectus]|uniref:Uncharacterized protein n=1 Tax=Acanthoscelides obtectus TaxID=200917 RepID=A0A9P0LZ51_ACAOB|nr:unnamed protein product [Acanthoscelides obtectus]CAK1624314.1 hypothetical protein AOBTE_LOCUS2488 [Acanthoscelides obtectus]
MLIRKYLFCLGLPVLAHAGDMLLEVYGVEHHHRTGRYQLFVRDPPLLPAKGR